MCFPVALEKKLKDNDINPFTTIGSSSKLLKTIFTLTTDVTLTVRELLTHPAVSGVEFATMYTGLQLSLLNTLDTLANLKHTIDITSKTDSFVDITNARSALGFISLFYLSFYKRLGWGQFLFLPWIVVNIT
jgi:hypothetical protein